MEFQVGDVVVLTGDLSWESFYAPLTGMSGTVVDTDPGDDMLLVSWDGYEDGHGDLCDEWWVTESDVDLA